MAHMVSSILHKEIDQPRLSEEDIEDRSKGDGFSKALTIIQTTWFIVQCIARWSNGLPVTELEVITLGFAMLNGTTYGLWWNKPQNVARPIFLESKEPQEVPDNIPDELGTIGNPAIGSTSPNDPEGALNDVHPDAISPQVQVEADSEDSSILAVKIILAIQIILSLLGLLVDQVFQPVATLWNEVWREIEVARTDSDYLKAGAAATFIGILVGSVHLIPSWFLEFPSRRDMWLWRAAAITTVVGPVLGGIIAYLVYSYGNRIEGIMTITFIVFVTEYGIILYIVARLTLFVISLISLHNLPPSALQTVEWTSFIPHL